MWPFLSNWGLNVEREIERVKQVDKEQKNNVKNETKNGRNDCEQSERYTKEISIKYNVGQSIERSTK